MLQCFPVSTVFDMVSSLPLTSFFFIYTCLTLFRRIMNGNTDARAIDQVCTRARLVKLRMCEEYVYGNFWSSQSRLLKVQIVYLGSCTNCTEAALCNFYGL